MDTEVRNAAARSGVHSIADQTHRIVTHWGSPLERKHGVWLGGSVLASMGTSTQFWMSRAEYEEHGAALISRKGLHYVW